MRSWSLWAVLLGFPCLADPLPTVPVGLDSYRQWDRWAQQRIGVRAYMRSTYDRRGGNEGADLIWVPIPFERSFQMAYTRTHYGTGYYIY